MSQAVPYDRTAAALSILTNAAEEIAPVMLPVAEMSPTGYLPMNGIAVLRATTAGAINIQWPCDGFLVAVMATPRDGTAVSLGSCLLRVQVDANTELFPSGTGGGAGFVPFSQIMNGLGRLAIRRPFVQATQWAMYVTNAQAGVDVVCDVTFAIINCSTPAQ
jgi:hypothetical protein